MKTVNAAGDAAAKNNEELIKKLDEMQKKFEDVIFLRNIAVLIVAALLVLAIINRNGGYPWGSDTYGHLFKGNILYDSLKSGKWFLNYSESWYNGVQPYRYWAPLPYYILAAINLITNNIITTYNVFIAVVFVIGGTGWLLWGYTLKRQNLALLIAILWFFVPNNLRILFSEGNIPFVVVNAILPYVFLFYYEALRKRKIRGLVLLAASMFVVTLSHAMLAAMTGLSLLIIALMDAFISKRYKYNLLSLTYAFLGIMCASFWLYPALKGGIMSIDKSAVSEVMKELTYPLSISLNPILRFSNIEVYYYGLAFAILTLFGVFMVKGEERAPFAASLVILLGTTRLTLPFLQKLPMNQLFWMSRFTSISMAMILMGLLLWKNLRKSLLVFITILLIADSACSFKVLGFNGQFPKGRAKTLDTAASIASQRIGVLDDSYFGSFPSYYIAYNSVKGVTDEVYGWAWQGATTSKNIVMLNTALERGYYDLMFDRALELGADTLLVKKSLITDYALLSSSASLAGYMKYSEDEDTLLYKYPGIDKFGTSVSYEGTVIGSYSSDAVYMFPKLTVGVDEYIDDYTYDTLKTSKVIYLSGFKYKNKKAAEDLVLKLSQNGVRIVIDATGLTESFLGVTAEPITINKSYGEIYYKNAKINMSNFPSDNTEWRTSFLNGIENDESYDVENHRIVNFIGSKYNDNLKFIGLNIPYYAFLTKDAGAVKIMEDAFGMKAFQLPKRYIHKVEIKRDGNILNISSDSIGVIVPLAALDAFKKVQGDFFIEDNLIYMKSQKVTIKIIYPYLKSGSIISVSFLAGICLISLALKKVGKRK